MIAGGLDKEEREGRAGRRSSVDEALAMIDKCVSVPTPRLSEDVLDVWMRFVVVGANMATVFEVDTCRRAYVFAPVTRTA